MSWQVWLKIIAKILIIIAEGAGREEAAGRAAAAFGVSVEEILKRGGF